MEIDEQDVEAAIGEEPELASPPPAAPAPGKKKKKSRGGRIPLAQEDAAVRPVVAAPNVSPSPRSSGSPPALASHPVNATTAAPKPPRAMLPKEESTKGVAARWPLVLEQLRSEGLDASAVVIRVARIGLGVHTGPGVAYQMPQVIDGQLVSGNELVAPGDALIAMITDVFHMPRRGPAKYICEFNYKVSPPGSRGGTIICNSEVTLDDPEQIIQEKRRMDEYIRTAGSGVGAGFSAAPRFAAQPYGVQPQGLSAPQLAPQQQLSAQASSQVEDLRRDLARLLGVQQANEEFYRMQGAAAAQAPVAAPPPAPAAPQISEQEREWIEEGKFRMMAAKLGWGPAGAPPPVVPPAPPQPPAQVVATGVSDPLAGLEVLLKGFERLDSLRPRFAKIAGVTVPEEGDEPETPEVALVKPDENPLGLQELPLARFQGAPIQFPTKAEGVVETVQAFLMANPSIALEGLSRVGTILSSGAFARLIDRLGAAGGVPAQAASQAVAHGISGTGTQKELTNGAATAAAAALAPLAPPSNGPSGPPPFRGPTA